ncbi:putative ribosomal N-acetyltransferase YdaF [bioreactor metagenome]|uniref:Putative ribosomal N-acetyltransferase YdaF n=1 Tax=bioreactor metagenome TaxID=1076179 RepID=A0A645ED99_9ZZZZ
MGSIGILLKSDVFAKCAEIGYWLGEPFWDKGLGTAAIVKMCEYAFAHYDINRIFAQTCGGNTGSRRALERAGFALEGVLKKCIYKNSKFYDGCIYALLKG